MIKRCIRLGEKKNIQVDNMCFYAKHNNTALCTCSCNLIKLLYFIEKRYQTHIHTHARTHTHTYTHTYTQDTRI